MPCYHPITAFKSKSLNPSGKRGLSFNTTDGYADLPVQIPCGQCIGCRLERSRQWAMRCIHEASLHTDNSFITLTYNDEHIPEDYGLNKKHFQDFMKRLRKSIAPKKIRYFHCGEYGEKNLRPHYHACIFGHDFDDKVLYATRDNTPLYTSAHLNNLWPFGFNTVGSVTFESAAYVARYIMKKININDNTPEHLRRTYERVNAQTGEVSNVIPEYTTMSRRPGIGKEWYEKYNKDIYPSDFLIVNNQKVQPPKFYDSMYEHIDKIKDVRRHKAAQRAANNTPERLATRESCQQHKLNQLIRPLDED